jgi:hypothetical protein
MGYRTAVLVYIAAGMTAAFGEDPQALRIRVLDYATVPVLVLRDFEPAARHLFEAANIDTEWRICRVATDEGDCAPLAGEEPYLKIVQHSPQQRAAVVFGSTVREGSINRFAYIFWERVDGSARREGVSASLLLAHVVAHEVGHLLGLDHAASGLMRRQFGPPDLVRAVKGRLRFSDREAGFMRDTLRGSHPRLAAASSHGK